MVTVTRLGEPSVVVNLGVLWWRGKQQEAKIFAIACLGALIVNTGLKLIFGKTRPHLRGVMKLSQHTIPTL